MTLKVLLRFALIMFITGGFAATLAAQTVELYPNAGGFWPTRMDGFGDNKLKAEGIYGLKSGVFVTPNAELEGSVGFINHFEMLHSPNPLNLNPAGTAGQPSIMGFLYDMNGAWNFGQRQFLNTRLSPYVSVGVGGLTAEIRHGSSAFLQGGGFAAGPTRVISDGDTFFTVNYGGGVKAMNLWGPVGLRADIRGRTIPNFFHETPSWPEVTGGLLFSWGER